MSVSAAGKQLQKLLSLKLPPVAMAFRDGPPPGIPRIETPAASGCTYWKLAAEGKVFYTEAADHYNCTVGAHTHGVELPPDRAQELQEMVETMVGLEYIKREEVGRLPRRAEPFKVAVYAPLAKADFEPDLVLVRGDARQIMLVAEAAHAVGIGHDGAVMGRPACAMIPETLRSGRAATSLGCIGNRVYTGLADEEFYFSIPGSAVAAMVERLAIVVAANTELEKFHRARAGAA